MIIDKTNRLDILLNSKRFVSDEQPGITLIIHNDSRDDSTIIIENPVNFSSLEDIKRFEIAINELKTLVLE